MNIGMLKTELYKIYSKKVIWVALLVFLGLFLTLKLQFINMAGVKYTLEPMRAELEKAVANEAFHNYVQKSGYSCNIEEIKQFIPVSIFEYIEQYHEKERIYRSLNSDLVSIINNYFERVDNRAAYIDELAQEVVLQKDSDLARAKRKLLQDYQDSSVSIMLNLESSANNFIDVNHSAIFPGLIMLIIIVGLAGIYSDEYINGTQAALLTSRKGRKGIFFSKLCAAGIFIISIVFIMESFFMIVTAICYHAPNGTISAASTYGFSLTTYGGSVYGFCFRQVLGTLLGGFVLGSIVMCISAYSKSALIPFFAAGIFYGGTAVYANMIVFPAYLSSIWSLPGELSIFMLQTQVELVAEGHYTNIFGLIVPTLVLNVIFNVLLMVICHILCYGAYTRKQVRE